MGDQLQNDKIIVLCAVALSMVEDLAVGRFDLLDSRLLNFHLSPLPAVASGRSPIMHLPMEVLPMPITRPSPLLLHHDRLRSLAPEELLLDSGGMGTGGIMWTTISKRR